MTRSNPSTAAVQLVDIAQAAVSAIAFISMAHLPATETQDLVEQVSIKLVETIMPAASQVRATHDLPPCAHHVLTSFQTPDC